MSEYKIYWGEQFDKGDTDYADWLGMQEHYAADNEKEAPTPIRYHYRDDDGELDMELNRENSGVELNYCIDDADCWWVKDPRDESFWVHFRYEADDDGRFNAICRAIGDIAIPPSWVRTVFMNRQQADLSSTEEIPSAWEFEVPQDGAA